MHHARLALEVESSWRARERREKGVDQLKHALISSMSDKSLEIK